MRMTKYLGAALVALAATAGLTSFNVKAQGTVPAVPTPAGTWWGIARACTTNSRFAQPPNTVDQAVCREACGGDRCPMSTAPYDEVAMMPQLFADGNVVATDHVSLVAKHTTGQGRWEPAGKAVIDGKEYQKVVASFLWFQPRSPQDVDPGNPFSIFQGAVHPRFVMFFDPANPDIVKGYIQPYVFNFTDKWGIVNMQPGTPFPSPDPLAPLPAVCNPTVIANPYCPGTFMFVVRRVQPR